MRALAPLCYFFVCFFFLSLKLLSLWFRAILYHSVCLFIELVQWLHFFNLMKFSTFIQYVQFFFFALLCSLYYIKICPKASYKDLWGNIMLARDFVARSLLRLFFDALHFFRLFLVFSLFSFLLLNCRVMYILYRFCLITGKIRMSCRYLSCLTYIGCHYPKWKIKNMHCTQWKKCILIIYHLWTFYNAPFSANALWNAKNNAHFHCFSAHWWGFDWTIMHCRLPNASFSRSLRLSALLFRLFFSFQLLFQMPIDRWSSIVSHVMYIKNVNKCVNLWNRTTTKWWHRPKW